jgi:hypothetical protein
MAARDVGTELLNILGGGTDRPNDHRGTIAMLLIPGGKKKNVGEKHFQTWNRQNEQQSVSRQIDRLCRVHR